MKKRRNIIIVAFIVLAIVAFLTTYFVLNKQDKNTTLTILDRQWIESHKNNRIDIEITPDIPVFNYNGEGVFFDFLESFEKDTSLEFNRVTIKDNSNSYAFKIVDNIGKNDILMYKDNYALVSKKNIKYSHLNEIKDMTIGVLEDDLNSTNIYLKGSTNIDLKTYSDINLLFDSLEKEEINGIIILKNYHLDDIIKNGLLVNYNLSDYAKYYVLSLGSEDKLNSIIKKYYKKWYNENYQKSYQKNFSDSYFLYKGIAERDKADFRGKRYSYGFVVNSPYDLLIDDSLIGINASILRDFSKIADIEISFEEYKTSEDLLKKFNANKIDLFFNSLEVSKYDMDVFNTVSTYAENICYVSSINNDIIINSVNSLKNTQVKVLKNSKISSYLKENKIDIKEYDDVKDLISSLNDKDVAAIDKETYNYYVRSSLSKFKVDFEETIDGEYNFTIRDVNENKIFNEFFNFYLSFIDEKNNLNFSYNKLLTTKSNKKILFEILLYLLALVGLIEIIYEIIKLISKLKNNKNKISKEHKLKYVDMLTSLKNRNYLNDNIEKWDNSEVYPQTIIVVDLNNVAYINDNYGHQEGDNLIKEAANILIKSQISNTEIIRTNGNEFLIYMVGYDEKQVIAYIRKLNKEFKELAHGFGAAVGYSTINDAIKTIDDAVNEATLDMRNNKEEVQN